VLRCVSPFAELTDIANQPEPLRGLPLGWAFEPDHRKLTDVDDHHAAWKKEKKTIGQRFNGVFRRGVGRNTKEADALIRIHGRQLP